MAVIKAEIRTGVYYDSAFLMRLQKSLNDLANVQDAGVVMGTETNREILKQSDLFSPEITSARPNDLVIVVRAEDEASAKAALGRVDELLTHRETTLEQEYLPHSLENAARMLPEAGWVLISVAGRYAAGAARDALRLGKHVFLFSDNVPVEEEVSLKRMAAEKGLLVMGPDCGTALIQGIGLGFANKVRRGSVGVVAAAGTGLQQVTSRIHQLGGGVSYGIGTGGRDLSEAVGAVTFIQGMDLLGRDPDTSVIVLVSKPPAPGVAEQVLHLARKIPKPVVVNFVGRGQGARQVGNLHFASGLDDAAALAMELLHNGGKVEVTDGNVARFASGQRYLRGLFSGGTLAYEAQFILQDYVPRVYANAPLKKENKLANALISQEHTIVDLGEDEFTVGRLHPMMDNELRIRRLLDEARDPQTAVIMLDVVLGYGSHPDPASELGPAIVQAKRIAQKEGRFLEVAAVVTGTDEDPQNMNEQIRALEKAGAHVETSNEALARYAGQIILALQPDEIQWPYKPVELESLQRPFQAINLGLEFFARNLIDQGASALQVDWRPPAGGNEKLMAILERMKGK